MPERFGRPKFAVADESSTAANLVTDTGGPRSVDDGHRRRATISGKR